MTIPSKTMQGRVVAVDGNYYRIFSPGAPEHLKNLLLTSKQMGGATIGDHVQLEYVVTSNSGLWQVVSFTRTTSPDFYERYATLNNNTERVKLIHTLLSDASNLMQEIDATTPVQQMLWAAADKAIDAAMVAASEMGK